MNAVPLPRLRVLLNIFESIQKYQNQIYEIFSNSTILIIPQVFIDLDGHYLNIVDRTVSKTDMALVSLELASPCFYGFGVHLFLEIHFGSPPASLITSPLPPSIAFFSYSCHVWHPPVFFLRSLFFFLVYSIASAICHSIYTFTDWQICLPKNVYMLKNSQQELSIGLKKKPI